MDARILCVDDEPNVAQAFQRQLRQFSIVAATGGELGLKAISEGPPFSVVVSDFRMPGMNGVQFLAKVRELSPDTVRIMLTGQAELSAAADAVNEGNVFRFLLKPCPSAKLAMALDAALAQHRLVISERELLEQTLKGAIELLSEILGMVNPEAFGRAHRMRWYMRHLSVALKLADQWQYEVAAMLSQVGCIAVPQEILDKIHLGQPVTDGERAIYASQFQIGPDLIARIPRLGIIAEMVRHQRRANRSASGAQTPELVAMGSEMLRLAADFDEAITKGASYASAITRLRAGGQYDPALVAALETLAEMESETEIRAVRIRDLKAGMRINADVHSKKGLLLLGKGQEITPAVIACLKSFSISPTGVIEPLTVVAARQINPEVPGVLDGLEMPGRAPAYSVAKAAAKDRTAAI